MKAKKVWIGAGLVVVVGALGWTGWQVWQVNRDLNDAVDHAEAIQRAVEDRDTATVDAELAQLREASGAAADRTAGLTWSALSVLPFVGDDVEGVEVTARVIDDLATDGIEPLVTASDQFEELLPEDGALDLALAEELAEPVAQASDAFAAADAELAEVDSSGFVGRLDTQFSDFSDQVSRAADALATADIATTVLPTMLGGTDGPQHYLLAFENNAEIRGMGGLVGAVSYVDADEGALELSGHVAASSLGEAREPVLPLTDAEVELYGEVVGTYAVNATMTPDAARASDLLRARWEQEFPDQPVDGVVFVDAVAIGHLLDATGPVTVDGVEITGDNAVDELLHETYKRLPEPAAQDAFFAAVAAATFEKFTAGLGNATGVLDALGRATDERRLVLHSFDDDVQAALAGTEIAGIGSAESVEAPQVTVTLNDMTGAKMSYFLRYDVNVNATSCRGETQTYSAKARVQSVAGPEAAELPSYITGGGTYGTEPGTQLVGVRVFGPHGGSVSDVELNGVPLDAFEVDQDGRPVTMAFIELAPGQRVDLAWRMASGEGQTGDTDVSVTPTIESKDSTRTLASACAGG